MLTIHQMAERTGVTIRALRYYDKIGLLPPGAVSPASYRLYGPAELERLQQILFFRELEFPLAEIKAILASPAYDRTAALTAQRALLREKRDRLDGLLRLVEAALKGETTMEMAFTAFDREGYEEKCRAYAREVKACWGDTAAWKENQERQQSGEETARGLPDRGGRADRGLCPEQAAASRAPPGAGFDGPVASPHHPAPLLLHQADAGGTGRAVSDRPAVPGVPGSMGDGNRSADGGGHCGVLWGTGGGCFPQKIIYCTLPLPAGAAGDEMGEDTGWNQEPC